VYIITMGMAVVAFFAANAGAPGTTIRSTLNQVRRKLGQAVWAFVFGKPVLHGKILSLDPSKLAEFLSQRFPKDGTTGSSARIQDADAKDFSCLLRLDGTTKRKKHGAKSDREETLADH